MYLNEEYLLSEVKVSYGMTILCLENNFNHFEKSTLSSYVHMFNLVMNSTPLISRPLMTLMVYLTEREFIPIRKLSTQKNCIHVKFNLFNLSKNSVLRKFGSCMNIRYFRKFGWISRNELNSGFNLYLHSISVLFPRHCFMG